MQSAPVQLEPAAPGHDDSAGGDGSRRDGRWYGGAGYRATLVRSFPYGLAALFFAAYTALSVSRHVRLKSTGYDLGIFEQAVRGYAQLSAPISELKGPGFHLLGDHFHPIVAVLAPLYRIWPSPVTLLVAQAALLALSVVPVARLAAVRAGPAAGVAIGAAYGLSWGLQQAVGFDFHEVCFGVPIMAFCLERLVQQRWASAAAWASSLLLVKEDMPLTVAAVGAYIFVVGRRRRLGAALVGGAAVVGLLVVFVIIPTFSPDHAYMYFGRYSSGTGTGPLSGLETKVETLEWLLLPTMFLALRSPLLLIALPTIAWRFGSSNPSYWGTLYHYSAVLMPIIFIAFIDGLGRLRTQWLRAVAVPVAAAIALVLATTQPLRELTQPSIWRTDARVSQVQSILSIIPDGATVAASNRLAPQLTDRCVVFLFPAYPTDAVTPDWAVVIDQDISPLPVAEVEAGRLALPGHGYLVVTQGPGVVLYRRAGTFGP